MKPTCWRCGSVDVRVEFSGYARAYCKKGCTERHRHYEDVLQTRLRCRSCGLTWHDGSGDFAGLAEGAA